MLIALAYHRDGDKALRLLRWMLVMAAVGETLKSHSILLIPSRHASKRSFQSRIEAEAGEIFKDARVAIPPEVETGWPGACNRMFSTALEVAGDDFLWLEPDAIPVRPDWLELVESEWDQAKKEGRTFLGGISKYGEPHMTGIGVYGKDWASLAPSLISIPDEIPWDVYAGPEILRAMKETHLIQHVNWEANKEPYDRFNMSMVDSRAAIFHQDKEQKLFHWLHPDAKALDRILGVSNPEQGEAMMRYFFTSNSNKPHKSQGYTFRFDPLMMVGGVWAGVYQTENEGEILALKEIEARGGSVKELSESEFQDRIQKKTLNSNNFTVPQPPSVPQVAVAQIEQRPALLVEKAVEEQKAAASVVNDIKDVLVIGRVKPPETAPKKAKRR